MVDGAALRARLDSVRKRIGRAASRVGRDASTIRLVAVAKTFGVEFVRIAAEAGQIDFGENRVQEAIDKMDGTADLPIRWHLVGHLQSNKARKAASRFDVIHSLHAVDLGDALERASRAAGHPIELLAQVDLADEPTKHGAREEQLAAMFEAAHGWQTARLVGLMVLPPAVDDPEQARPYFRAVKTVRDRLLARGVDAAMLSELSMGMSHDFEVAVEEGATLVRVGTAIFGGRANV
jgi:pyridoxal phosphate enzyme (YggS family)